jgi:hypothetical protein
MLRDGVHDQGDLVHALVAAAGPDAGAELLPILQDELQFWQKVGPTLDKNWWNAGPSGIRDVLRDRYDLIETSLEALAKNPYPPARDTVIQLRNVLAPLPVFNEPLAINGAVANCDRIIAAN